MSARKHFPFGAAVAAALVLSAGQAAAHARLVASSPAAEATVAAPKTITLTFNEKLVAAFSSFEVASADGRATPVTTAISKDGKSITGVLRGGLAPGAYKITWRAASADGHRMSGVLAFKVA